MNRDSFPLDKVVFENIIAENRVDIKHASIRQVNLVVLEAEKRLGTKFIRMEFGVPGLRADERGWEFERDLMRSRKVNSDYPPFNGTEEFRKAASRFFKMFTNIDIPHHCVVATCGAQQGCFLTIGIAGRTNPKKNCVLFIDPGFSVNKLQTRFHGLKSDSIDIYDRKNFLRRLEKRLSRGDVSAALWSSPNNPTWNVLSPQELKAMGDMFNRYGVIAIEDAAYFGMDYRTDYSVPGAKPFIPTIAQYADDFVVLLSSSKIFNYAGQRVGCSLISPKLAEKEFENLSVNFAAKRFIDAFVQGGIYPTTSGVTHSAQLAVAHMMDLASEGKFNFVEPLRIYGERAKFFKRILLDNKFSLVYGTDGDLPLADGFYFTVSFSGMEGSELLQELLYYGISVTTLNTFGSSRTEGVRICVSLAGEDTYETFKERIESFAADH